MATRARGLRIHKVCIALAARSSNKARSKDSAADREFNDPAVALLQHISTMRPRAPPVDFVHVRSRWEVEHAGDLVFELSSNCVEGYILCPYIAKSMAENTQLAEKDVPCESQTEQRVRLGGDHAVIAENLIPVEDATVEVGSLMVWNPGNERR